MSPPFSERTRYVERIRQTAPDRLESQITIEDPETLERAWVLELGTLQGKSVAESLLSRSLPNGRFRPDYDTGQSNDHHRMAPTGRRSDGRRVRTETVAPLPPLIETTRAWFFLCSEGAIAGRLTTA